MKRLMNKTWCWTLYKKEYKCHTFWSCESKPVIADSYFELRVKFNFKEGIWFSVKIPNAIYSRRNPFEAALRALEHESIGMAKYNHLKDRIREIGQGQKL